MHTIRLNFIDSSWQYELVSGEKRVFNSPSFDDVWDYCMTHGINPHVENWSRPDR